MIEKSIATNAITALDQLEYAKTYESLTERYTTLQKRYTTLTRQREDKQFKADELSGFLFEIGELDLLDTEWKDSRFRAKSRRRCVRLREAQHRSFVSAFEGRRTYCFASLSGKFSSTTKAAVCFANRKTLPHGHLRWQLALRANCSAKQKRECKALPFLFV